MTEKIRPDWQADLESCQAELRARYGDLGDQAADRLATWLSGDVPFAEEQTIAAHLSAGKVDLLFDCFYQVLPFGTGGRRGRVGYGPNRLNPTTVAMTVQGHCHYLREAFPDREEPCVVVANDVRLFQDIAGTYGFLADTGAGEHPLLGVSSRSLGRLACEVYAANGFIAYFTEPEQERAYLTTPELSFTLAQLGAVGGLNLSASHNPPDDNGVKVYDGFGSQPIAPDDQHLIDAMTKATEVQRLPFEQALRDGMVRAIPRELHEVYIQRYVDLYDDVWTPRQETPIVFTPLCGCGLDTVGDVMERIGFPIQSPPAEGPDGRFPGIPFSSPNPEVPEATAPARAFAQGVGATAVLSSDPDADRVGIEIRLEDGSWYHFDGNQIATVLAYYLMLDPAGPQRRGLVIETLVTNKILGRIVDEAGDSDIVDDLLVGFKYVANVLKKLDRGESHSGITRRPDELVLATEESHGVIMVPEIRDKDATPACLFLAALHQRLVSEGRTMLDYYVEIVERLGPYDCVNRSIVMLGAEGMLRKEQMMRSLRDTPPQTLLGEPVQKVVDYWDEQSFGPFVSESDRLPRNVVQIFTEPCVLTVRPSGTEAKVKLYVQMLPSGPAPNASGRALLTEIRGRARAIADQVYNELLGRLDLSLSNVALLLPDIVDLEQKLRFDAEVTPALRARLESVSNSEPESARTQGLEQLLEWLRAETAAMTPGSDSLPAVRSAVAALGDGWRSELPHNELLAKLRDWAS